MQGGIDAAGDIATGMLIGRAVENRAGEALPAGHAHGICLNCGTALVGDYCHACGQSEHVHRSLAAIGHDLLHGVFHFEGKAYRTLPMLVVRPGALTRRYVAGERARFVSPLALFLFSVFLLFATIHGFGGELDTPGTLEQRQKVMQGMSAELAKSSAELDRIDTERTAAIKAGKSTKTLDEQRTALHASIKALETASGTLRDGKLKSFTFTDLKTGWATLDKGIAKANANPGLALYKLQSSAYKYSWALIPISVPFVALLFLWRRRFKLYDHAIFVTYSLAFMMLLVITLTLAGLVGVSGGLIAVIAVFAPPVHIFFQLRGAYSLRKRSALWRTVLLTSFSFTALILWGTMLLAMGLTE